MNIKNIILSIFFISITAAVYAQQAKEVSHYIFPDFIQGTVLMKNGTENHALLNYNAASQEMIFDQNGKKLAIAPPTLNQIDTVFISDKKFVRHNNKFMEVLLDGEIQLFAEHKCRIIPPPKPAAYGGTSETSSVDSYSSWQTDGRLYNLELPNDFKVNPITVYWIKKNGELKNFVSINQIRKYYKNKKKELKEYEKEHKIDFQNNDDILQLIKFTESL